MFTRIYTEDIDVAKRFVGECNECLEGLEREVLKLEVDPENPELLAGIYQKVHAIKCGSSFLGLSAVTGLSREAERVLEAAGEGRVTLDNLLIDHLLLFADFVREYTAGLRKALDAFREEKGFHLEFEQQGLGQKYEDLMLAFQNDVCDAPGAPGETGPKEAPGEPSESEELKEGLAAGIKEQFLLESGEYLELIENDLLMRLDANPEDREAVNEIFRAIHSIKGGAGLYLSALSPQSPEHGELKKFSDAVHTYESLLALIRDGGHRFENQFLDLSFSVIDCFKSFLYAAGSGEKTDWDNHEILEAIREDIDRLREGSGEPARSLPAMPRREPEKEPKADKAEDKAKSAMVQSIRVSQEKIDKMMNTISELFIAKNSFMHISSRLSLDYDLPEMSKEVKQVGAYINRISDELQNAIMSIRMVEIRTVFQKMPRIVRDIAQSTGKKMELQMEGENTEIDKTIIESISDPLVHLIRNAADHGIESPQERLAKGKPETGKITLKAYNKNKHVFIEIEDDGKGMDAERLKEKAVEKGLLTRGDAERMSRSQLLNLIFLPGFSTAKQVTEISGRGVGMDIVRSNIAKISGTIKIESEVDKGTKMTIQLPLSLAVSRGLVVETAGESYIIPLEYIVETVKINSSSIHEFNGKSFTYLRGEVIRVEWLGRIFAAGGADSRQEEMNAVILSNGAENFAIVVDRLKNEQEFVVKPLEGQLASIPGISGSTLLGNGKVVLILNPADILQLAEK